MKNFYLKRVFDINPCGGKQIYVGLFIRGSKCMPSIVIVGDKAKIVLDVDGWRTLMDKKAAVDSFFARRSDDLNVKLDSEQHMTSLQGQAGDLTLACFYQSLHGQDARKYLHLAQVTVDKMFAVRRLVDHYFELLEKSASEIEEFLKLYHSHRSTGTAINFETKFTSVGVSLSMLYHELACYEQNFYK